MNEFKKKDVPGFWFGLFGFMGRNSLAFAGGVLFAYYSHNTIQKIDYNLFEGKTTVKQGYFQNPQELQIFFDKKDGQIIPSYGTIDSKIPIGTDMKPLGYNAAMTNADSIKLAYGKKLAILNEREQRMGAGYEKFCNEVDSLLKVNDSLIFNTVKKYGGK